MIVYRLERLLLLIICEATWGHHAHTRGSQSRQNKERRQELSSWLGHYISIKTPLPKYASSQCRTPSHPKLPLVAEVLVFFRASPMNVSLGMINIIFALIVSNAFVNVINVRHSDMKLRSIRWSNVNLIQR